MTSQAMKKTQKKTIDKKEFFDKYRSLIALALLVVVVSILSPSFLTTNNGAVSILSKVVKRKPQFSHSLRRLIARFSSLGRESITREAF